MELTKVDRMFVPSKKNTINLPQKKPFMSSSLRANSASKVNSGIIYCLDPRPRTLKGPLPKLNTSFKQAL